MIVFVVSEVNFYYDDQYYSAQGNGDPVSVFRTEEEAEAECTLLNRETIRERMAPPYGRLSRFLYGGGMELDEGDADLYAIAKVFGVPEPADDGGDGSWLLQGIDDFINESKAPLTDEQCDAIRMLVPFYKVFEAEMPGTSELVKRAKGKS